MPMTIKKSEPSVKVLIVDDDNDVLNLLETWLTTEKFDVKRALSGSEALNLVGIYNLTWLSPIYIWKAWMVWHY